MNKFMNKFVVFKSKRKKTNLKVFLPRTTLKGPIRNFFVVNGTKIVQGNKKCT